MSTVPTVEAIQLIVPFYVDHARADPIRYSSGDLTGLFDHPTLLGGHSTLPRFLHSLARLDPPAARLTIIVAASEESLLTPGTAWARSLLEDASPSIEAEIFGDTQQRMLRRNADDTLRSLFDCRSYSGVRNLCLLAALRGGAEISILLDDDECIRQPDFLQRIADRFVDPQLDALAGLYMEQGERLFFPRPEPLPRWQSAFDPGAQRLAAFAALEAAIARGETAARPAPFAFGGNLAIRRCLAAALPFDLSALRGEDVDYALSARCLGRNVLLDPCLLVDHFPPPRTAPVEATLEQEGRRYLTLQRKLLCAKEQLPQAPSFEAIAPFPGAFLSEDLGAHLEQACSALADDFAASGEQDRAKHCHAARERLAQHATRLRDEDPWEDYLLTVDRWRRFVQNQQGEDLFYA